jgi:hypothetical protein
MGKLGPPDVWRLDELFGVGGTQKLIDAIRDFEEDNRERKFRERQEAAIEGQDDDDFDFERDSGDKIS